MKANPKKIFHSDKLGSNPVFALDEVKRILVIYANVEVRIRTAVDSGYTNRLLGSRTDHPVHL